ncbi:MAG: DUF296 domain-containing protein [archaeon]|jgi:hypothetical protein
MSLNSLVVNGKVHKKKLTIVLEEGEDLHACIRESMQTNGISKADLISITGTLSKACFNYFQKSSYKSKNVENVLVIASSGHFELSNKTGLFGTIKIAVREFAKNNTYTLTKASAKEGLTIELEFFEMG